MDASDLKAFEAVARRGSISGAAQELNGDCCPTRSR